jgi:hypothetical protein
MVAVLPGCGARPHEQIACKGRDSAIFLLEAQAVPSATLIPCFYPLPVGWKYGQSEVRSGFVSAWLDSDRAGVHAVRVILTRACDVSRANRVRLAHAPRDLVRYDEPSALHPHSSLSYFRFPGGCVRYQFSFTRQAAPAIFQQADDFLGFTRRSVYVNSLRDQEGLTLCGAEAPPCPG